MGDALSSTPAIYSFWKKFRLDYDITVAFPDYCIPLFKGVLQVADCRIINKKEFDKVIDIGNPCPAAEYESINKEKTTYSRVQLFAKGLGFNPDDFRNVVPIYHLTNIEAERSEIFKKTKKGIKVGISLHSNEAYRDYTKMKELIEAICDISIVNHVILFGQRDIEIKNDKIFRVIDKDVRYAISLQASCDLFISPDTMFLHSAAALRLQTILLDGPLHGPRFGGYPIKVVNASDKYKCIPCWRNSYTPCIYSPFDVDSSLCMDRIEVQDIIKEVNNCILF